MDAKYWIILAALIAVVIGMAVFWALRERKTVAGKRAFATERGWRYSYLKPFSTSTRSTARGGSGACGDQHEPPEADRRRCAAVVHRRRDQLRRGQRQPLVWAAADS